jgi:hypothetical protein
MSPEQWEIVIEGMRNPMNSWDRMDSMTAYDGTFILGENDHKLMMSLAKGGAVHAKYRRMMPVWITLTAPLYWWKEFDTYKVGTVCNSCSTMHKIHDKEFTLDDFSCEHLNRNSMRRLEETVETLNMERDNYLMTGNKDAWWQMIQLLPTTYNQKRTIMLTYEVLHNIRASGRPKHKLDEWHTFCDWIESLPYSEIITGGE